MLTAWAVISLKRRVRIVFFATVLVFVLVLVRIGTLVNSTEVQSVGLDQGTRSVTVVSLRGTIYDRNHIPLVNADNEYSAAFLPSSGVLKQLRTAMNTVEYNQLIERLERNTPAVVQLQRPAAIADGMRVFFAPVRYTDYCPCPHILGHLDGSMQYGVTGIEKAFDSFLNQHTGQIKATFSVNGLGDYVEGSPIQVTNTLNNSTSGVVLTIDKEIQQIVDDTAPEFLEKGAVVIIDPRSGEVLAGSSFPSFHPGQVADSMDDADGALLNRMLSLYDCGSVFKIVTAVAALENGFSIAQTYDCAGGMTVQNTVFHCHQRLGHQTLTMDEAFAKSCNLYFIQLAAQLGAEKLLETAEKLGLTDAIELADSLIAPRAVLPTKTELVAPAALANLSFGQGKLLVSPLHIARMTAVMAANGTLQNLQLISGTLTNEDGFTQAEKRGGETVITAATISALRRMMELVVTDGTGTRAQPDNITAAGKTGTAQTGQYNNGQPVVQSWFTGYIPADNPQYVVTILAEDAETTDADATGLFCEISNKLTELKRNGG